METLVQFQPHGAWGTPAPLRSASSWIRKITGIDYTQAGGYSLLGEFIARPRRGGVVRLETGKLYLDCEIVANTRTYRLFKVEPQSTVQVIAQTPDVQGWAYSLHPYIKQELGAAAVIKEAVPSLGSATIVTAPTPAATPATVTSGNPLLANFSTEDLIAEVRHRLALDALADLPL